MGKHGVSTTTPENVLLGAGTIHKNLKWDSASKKWTGDIIGATAGGNKLAIAGEVIDIELDGALVKVKGLAVKQGGTASLEVNFAELNSEVIQRGTLFEIGESDAEGYILFKDKADITEGDYIENFGFVGKTANGKKDIIVIFENSLCTSGFELEGKNKENSVVKLTMEAYANIDGDLDTLPVKIYYPTEIVG
ncbi:MAG: hypothetical protein J6Q39_08325 [Bacteroidales bacterium]|nr:hypothetical protein [Bacteroidales bacterium]